MTSASTETRAARAHCYCDHRAVRDATIDLHRNSLQRRGKALEDMQLKVNHLELQFLYS